MGANAHLPHPPMCYACVLCVHVMYTHPYFLYSKEANEVTWYCYVMHNAYQGLHEGGLS